jgi:uncharacterized protein YdeI (YjbR/CyaY-like superfamily)
MTKNPSVDQYLITGCMRCSLGATPACKVHKYVEILSELREIIFRSELTEERKWGVPCYTLNGKNVILLSAFKEYACITFVKGILMSDPYNLLMKQGENQNTWRIIKFKKLEDVTSIVNELHAYVTESINIERSGINIPKRENYEPIPPEFEEVLAFDPEYSDAFFKLTKGRQRGYIIYISQPKGSEARFRRVNQCRPKILLGEGLHDKYSVKKKGI